MPAWVLYSMLACTVICILGAFIGCICAIHSCCCSSKNKRNRSSITIREKIQNSLENSEVCISLGRNGKISPVQTWKSTTITAGSSNNNTCIKKKEIDPNVHTKNEDTKKLSDELFEIENATQIKESSLREGLQRQSGT